MNLLRIFIAAWNPHPVIPFIHYDERLYLLFVEDAGVDPEIAASYWAAYWFNHYRHNGHLGESTMKVLGTTQFAESSSDIPVPLNTFHPVIQEENNPVSPINESTNMTDDKLPDQVQQHVSNS